MEHDETAFDAIANAIGVRLDGTQRTQLLRFSAWLSDEAVTAGGIGPREADRMFDRHIADSLMFLAGVPESAATVVDVGGGVGLPSIPMAIARPDLTITLVDRSRKRTDLAGRAGRILGLENLVRLTSDIHEVSDMYDLAVFRASLGLEDATAVFTTHVVNGGVGLFAVSRKSDRPSIPKAPEGITFELSSEGDDVLDTPFWLLRMHRR